MHHLLRANVEPFHLFRYLDEQAFRYNNRTVTDADRFDTAVRQILGRRVTYRELTGKEALNFQIVCPSAAGGNGKSRWPRLSP